MPERARTAEDTEEASGHTDLRGWTQMQPLGEQGAGGEISPASLRMFSSRQISFARVGCISLVDGMISLCQFKLLKLCRIEGTLDL